MACDDDQFYPGAASVDSDHCVVGGRLPPGAVSAEVVDDRGMRVSAVVVDGVYALLDHRGPVSVPGFMADLRITVFTRTGGSVEGVV